MYRAVVGMIIIGLACVTLACEGDPAANPTAPQIAESTAQAVGQKKPEPPDPVDLFNYQVDYEGELTGSASAINIADYYPKNRITIVADSPWLDFSALVADWSEGEVCFGSNLENVDTFITGGVARINNVGPNSDPITWPFQASYTFEAKGKDPDSSRTIRYRIVMWGAAGQVGADDWLPPEGKPATISFDDWSLFLVKGPRNLACEAEGDLAGQTITVTNLGPRQ